MKDQLCTLLITFSDGKDPIKQVTTTHTFASTNPDHYPQQRTVAYSEGKDEEDINGELRPITTVLRSSAVPFGKLGEDMLEQTPVYRIRSQPFAQLHSPVKSHSTNIRELNVLYENKKETRQTSIVPVSGGLPRTDYKIVERSRHHPKPQPQQQQTIVTPPVSLTTSKAIRVETPQKAIVRVTTGDEAKSTEAKKTNVPTPSKRNTSGLKKEEKKPKTSDKMPYQHQALSYESVQESYARGNRETRLVYERHVSETHTTRKSHEGSRNGRQSTTYRTSQPIARSSPPPSTIIDVQRSTTIDSPGYTQANLRRLPRYHDDDIRLYTRYGDPPPNVRPAVNVQRSTVSDSKPKSTYIIEEWREEEHYAIRHPPRGSNQTSKQNQQAQSLSTQTSEPLKVDVGLSTTQKTSPPLSNVRSERSQDQAMRIIDYSTYHEEMERLQREAVRSPTKKDFDSFSSVPLTPAIVLPTKPISETTTNVKSSEVFETSRDQQHSPRKVESTATQSKHVDSSSPNYKYVLRTRESREHHESSLLGGMQTRGYPDTSPTPLNTPMSPTSSPLFVPESDADRHIREVSMESFKEKIEILKSSRRFRQYDGMTGGSPSPHLISPATETTTRRADSHASQHSETFSAASPAQQTITSFPATPLPVDEQQTSQKSFEPLPSTPSPKLHGVLTKETTHQFITDRIVTRTPQSTEIGRTPSPLQTTTQTDQTLSRTDEMTEPEETVFPIYPPKDRSPSPQPIVVPTEPPVIDVEDEEERRYLESVRRNLSYEEQIDLEIRRRRRDEQLRRREEDLATAELLSIVDEEDEHLVNVEESTIPIASPPDEQIETTETRVYIDEISARYEGPYELLSPKADVRFVEFSPELPPVIRLPQSTDREIQEVTLVPAKKVDDEEEDESRFDELIETETRRQMEQIGERTPTKYESTTKFESKVTSERSTFPTISLPTSLTTSTDELKYRYAEPLPSMDTRTEYRSNISSRANFSRPQRALSPLGSQGFTTNSRVLKILTESSSVGGSGFSPYGGSSAATTIRDTREREKKEMSDLNDRLASYIEKVRFLEAQNRKLATDLEFLRSRYGKDSVNVRDMYEGDLKQARRVYEEAEKLRNDLLEECRLLQEDINSYRRKYDDALRSRELNKEQLEDLLNRLSALESELNLLRRRISNLEADLGSTKRENHHLITALQRARTDLDQETLNRIDYQNQAQTLIEEIEFLRRAHDSEIRDLQAMASRDTTSENREYFKNELAAAIRDIRGEYDQLTTVHRTDMESWYKLKVQEIQTQSARHNMEQTYAADEIKRLRSQLSDLRGKLADLEGRNAILEKNLEELNFQLEDDQRNYESALNDRDTQIRKIRDECQMLMVELQMLLDTKQTLDAEIAIYRKMLEGEEDRAGLRQLVESVVRTHHVRQADESESMRVLRGETSSRHSYQRSAKGNVSISEAAPDGRYVILENTHRAREEYIGEWKLKRIIDNRRDIVYTFPRDFVLAPGKSVKISARNQGVLSPPDQLIFNEEDSFGVGTHVQTILYNTQGEERATLIQRSSQN